MPKTSHDLLITSGNLCGIVKTIMNDLAFSQPDRTVFGGCAAHRDNQIKGNIPNLIGVLRYTLMVDADFFQDL
ncbi:MAG: hypothetical protein MUO58_12035 [Anaerolineales bacterium]|nr:hypothetical protein [Anaerolineales bacterium]